MKVRWILQARFDALECAAHIQKDDPAAALRWLEGLDVAAARLADFPSMGRIVHEPGIDE